VSMEALHRSAKAFINAAAKYSIMLELTLPIGRKVFCFVRHKNEVAWFDGTVAAHVADSTEVCVKPKDEIAGIALSGLVNWNATYKWLRVEILDIHLQRHPRMD